MELRPYPMPHQISYDPVSVAGCASVDRCRNLVQKIPCQRMTDSIKKTLSCTQYQIRRFCRYFAYSMSSGCIRMVSLIHHPDIQAYDISFFQQPPLRRNSVYNLFVHRNADRCRIPLIVFKRRDTAVAANHFFPNAVNL